LRNDQTHKLLILSTVLNADIRFAGLVDDLEREMFNVGLYFRIRELAANEALRVEDTREGD